MKLRNECFYVNIWSQLYIKTHILNSSTEDTTEILFGEKKFGKGNCEIDTVTTMMS